MSAQSPILRPTTWVAVLLIAALPSSAGSALAQNPAADSSIAEDVAALLPAGTLVHVDLDGAAAARTADSLAISKILREPEVKQFLKHVLGYLRAAKAGFEAQIEFMIDGSIEEVHEVLKGHLTLSFLGMTQEMHKEGDLEWATLVPRLIMTWRLGSKETTATRLLASGEKLLRQETGMRPVTCDVAGNAARKLSLGSGLAVTYLVKDGLFIAGTELESLARFVSKLDGAPGTDSSLAATESFKKAAARVSRPDSILKVFVSVEGLIGAFGPQIPEEMRGVMGAGGFDDIASFSVSLGFDGAGVRERFHMGIRPGSKLFKLYAGQHAIKAQRLLPAETGFFYAGALDWSGVHDWAMELLRVADAHTHEQAMAGIAMVGQMIGAEVRKDILPKLGQEFCLAASWPHQGLVPDVALLLQLKDKAGMEGLCKGLTERFAGRLRTGSLEYMDHTIHWFGPSRMGRIDGAGFRPQIRISWTVVDDFLVVTPWPQAAKNLIRGIRNGRPRLADNPEFKKVAARIKTDVPHTGDTLLMYADLKGLAGFVLDNGVPFIQSLIPDTANLDVPVDIKWALWPSTDVITKHLEGMVAGGCIQQDGYYGEYYSPTGILVPQVLVSLGMMSWVMVAGDEIPAMGLDEMPPTRPVTTRPSKGK